VLVDSCEEARVCCRGGDDQLTGPTRHSAPMARLRRQTMTCGAVPVRTWEASSAKVTSRTTCGTFSMDQCPRMRSAIRAGLAAAWARLVTA
jgi:hypothetical protein